MKSKIYYPSVSSEHFYKDEEPTSFTSLPNSPSSSSHVLSPLQSHGKLSSPRHSISSPKVFTAAHDACVTPGSTKKGGLLSKVFGRRKSMSATPTYTTTTTAFDSNPRSQHLTKKLSSKALDCLQESEQQYTFTNRDQATPTCSDLSGESGLADSANVHSPTMPTSHYADSMRKKTTITNSTSPGNIILPVPFQRGNMTDLLERIPNLPPLQTPIWVNTMKFREERAHVSPKRRASLPFGENSFSFVESSSSPRFTSAALALGLKPPPLTFQESDKKLPALKPPPPALKSPPIPQPSQLEDSVEIQPDDLMFEIEPGHSLPLRGRKQESKNYIQEGKEIATQECVCCEGMIHCVGDASLLLCPFCRVVQPLLLTSSEREAYGLALGFSSQEWIEMSSEDAWATA